MTSIDDITGFLQTTEDLQHNLSEVSKNEYKILKNSVKSLEDKLAKSSTWKEKQMMHKQINDLLRLQDEMDIYYKTKFSDNENKTFQKYTSEMHKKIVSGEDIDSIADNIEDYISKLEGKYNRNPGFSFRMAEVGEEKEIKDIDPKDKVVASAKAVQQKEKKHSPKEENKAVQNAGKNYVEYTEEDINKLFHDFRNSKLGEIIQITKSDDISTHFLKDFMNEIISYYLDKDNNTPLKDIEFSIDNPPFKTQKELENFIKATDFGSEYSFSYENGLIIINRKKSKETYKTVENGVIERKITGQFNPDIYVGPDTPTTHVTKERIEGHYYPYYPGKEKSGKHTSSDKTVLKGKNSKKKKEQVIPEKSEKLTSGIEKIILPSEYKKHPEYSSSRYVQFSKENLFTSGNINEKEKRISNKKLIEVSVKGGSYRSDLSSKDSNDVRRYIQKGGKLIKDIDPFSAIVKYGDKEYMKVWEHNKEDMDRMQKINELLHTPPFEKLMSEIIYFELEGEIAKKVSTSIIKNDQGVQLTKEYLDQNIDTFINNLRIFLLWKFTIESKCNFKAFNNVSSAEGLSQFLTKNYILDFGSYQIRRKRGKKDNPDRPLILRIGKKTLTNITDNGTTKYGDIRITVKDGIVKKITRKNKNISWKYRTSSIETAYNDAIRFLVDKDFLSQLKESDWDIDQLDYLKRGKDEFTRINSQTEIRPNTKEVGGREQQLVGGILLNFSYTGQNKKAGINKGTHSRINMANIIHGDIESYYHQYFIIHHTDADVATKEWSKYNMAYYQPFIKKNKINTKYILSTSQINKIESTILQKRTKISENIASKIGISLNSNNGIPKLVEYMQNRKTISDDILAKMIAKGINNHSDPAALKKILSNGGTSWAFQKIASNIDNKVWEGKNGGETLVNTNISPEFTKDLENYSKTILSNYDYLLVGRKITDSHIESINLLVNYLIQEKGISPGKVAQTAIEKIDNLKVGNRKISEERKKLIVKELLRKELDGGSPMWAIKIITGDKKLGESTSG